MGTRHLICVVHDAQTKVAQYGQWNGYPQGAGVEILDFLRDRFDRERFLEGLACGYVLDEDAMARLLAAEGATSADIAADTVPGPLWSRVLARHPSLSRDTGSRILDLVQEAQTPFPLRDSRAFAGDSLFCEWAYVIDLDANRFEVYEGFNKTDLTPNERFSDLARPGEDYRPVRLRQSFAFDALPTIDDFLAAYE